MNISVGLYTLVIVFFFIAVPGYIARRFYFNGEFTKTFNYSKNHIRNITYSLFLGICITLILVSLINFFQTGLIDIESILNSFDQNFINRVFGESKKTDNEIFKGISNSIYTVYIPYLGMVYIMAATFGYVCHRIVLLLSWDTRFKVLRYKNPWHYLFTGRILKTNKFKKSNQSKLNVKYTYVDVLTTNQNESNTLYSGLYADYHLNSSKPSELEKICLIETSRYSKRENKVIKKDIPGNILTINGNCILNVNFTYVFEAISDKRKRKFLKLTQYKSVIDNIIIFFFIFLLVSILFKLNLSDKYWYQTIINSSIFMKILWALLLNMLVGFLNILKPNKERNGYEFIGFISLSQKFMAIVSVIFIMLISYSVFYDVDWSMFFQ